MARTCKSRGCSWPVPDNDDICEDCAINGTPAQQARAEKAKAASPAPVESGDIDWLRGKVGEILAMSLDVEPTDNATEQAVEQILALRALKPMESDAARELLPSFNDAWAKKEIEGYRYGRDALENVRLGYEMAEEHLRALSLRPEVEEGRLHRERDALLAECDEQNKTITRLTDVLNRARRALLRGGDQIEAAAEIDALALASRPIPAEMPDVADLQIRLRVAGHWHRAGVRSDCTDLLVEAATALERMSEVGR